MSNKLILDNGILTEQAVETVDSIIDIEALKNAINNLSLEEGIILTLLINSRVSAISARERILRFLCGD